MTELLMHHMTVHSNQMDRFVIRIELLANGRASVTMFPGPLNPVIVFPGEPTSIDLTMPYTPDAQPLALQITREKKP
jgi:hypothetical protein